MSRRARLRIAGLPLHLIQRGNNRTACFFADEDYWLYLRHLKELSREFRCAVHACVLMTNHVHLLLTPARKDGTSLLMKHLGQRDAETVVCPLPRGQSRWTPDIGSVKLTRLHEVARSI
jgi:putative transposase